MEKRQIAFIVISLIFLILWDYFFVRRQPTQNPVFNKSTSKTIISDKKQEEKRSGIENLPLPLGTYTLKTIDTQIYHAVFAQENGFLKRMDLKKYRKTLNSDQPIDIFREGRIEGFDVLDINGKQVRILYKSMDIKEQNDDVLISFYSSYEDIEVTKVFQLSKTNYGGRIKFYIKNNGSEKDFTLITMLQLPNTVFDTSVEANPQPVFFYNTSFDTPSERSLKKGYIRENVLFAGYAEKYFGIFLVDESKTSKAEATIENNKTEVKLKIANLKLMDNSSFEREIKLYAGPKDERELKMINPKLVASIDYGWFHFISKPLLMIMNFFNKFTKNYGISIILLTILIKLVFFPLSHKSYKSMKELQKLQPKMEELRKKFANDREALNREMMLLYRRHGVNPLSGCLPILIQIPFFIALYQALMHAIELRHAPFFGWIKDLSSYDPYYVTPVLMGITMLIQQIMTPSTGDPTQKKMMYLLPVVFTFMFLKFPSGLVLYWLVNNVFSIFQQMYTLKAQKA